MVAGEEGVKGTVIPRIRYPNEHPRGQRTSFISTESTRLFIQLNFMKFANTGSKGIRFGSMSSDLFMSIVDA